MIGQEGVTWSVSRPLIGRKFASNFWLATEEDWGLSQVGGIEQYGYTPHKWQIFSPYVTNPNCLLLLPIFDKSHPHIWQIPMNSDYPLKRIGVCHKWVGFINMGTLPINDKSSSHIRQIPMKYFCKGYPLRLLKSWNRALWLVEKASHDQFPGLSLVENLLQIFD